MLEKTLESPLDSKEILANSPWIFIGRTDAEAEVLILWLPDAKSRLIGKRPWCWERLKAGEDDRGWDGWMVSLTRWTWTWANSRKWWGTRRPRLLQSMGWQRVRHNLVTEQLHSTGPVYYPLDLLPESWLGGSISRAVVDTFLSGLLVLSSQYSLISGTQ